MLKSIKLRFRRLSKRISLTKRQQFVIAVFIYTSGLVLTQLVPIEMRIPFVSGLSVFTYLGTAFVLREDLKRVEWLTLLILPVLFTFGVSMYYFLLPVRWLTRIPVATLYAIGMYAIILTENIYNVAVNRTIALLRAAHSIGFLLTIVTYYLLQQWLLIGGLPEVYRIVLSFLFSWLLYLQLFWSVSLDTSITAPVFSLSVSSAAVITEIVLILLFWPVNKTISALFLTTVFYAMAALVQQYLMEKLYRKTVWEYLAVVAVVFVVVVLGTNWRMLN
jgi:hypothetical protein